MWQAVRFAQSQRWHTARHAARSVCLFVFSFLGRALFSRVSQATFLPPVISAQSQSFPVTSTFFFFSPQHESGKDVVTVSAGVMDVQYILCPISLTATLHHALPPPPPGPMFPTWESFVFSVSAAMMWDNVGGQWSRQGSIGISILLCSPCPPAGVPPPHRPCDEATGADGV